MTLEQRLDQTYRDLLSHLPGIREGNPEAIHAARVATRRMRTILMFLEHDSSGEQWKEIATAVKRTGRALGRARDIDVALSLLSDLQERSPGVAAAAAEYRARLLPRQVRAQRKLIKRLEKTLSSSSFSLELDRPRSRPLLKWSETRHAGHQMVAAVADRARDAKDRIGHATGVYFANRAHSVRGTLRKLRYLLELSDESPERRRALKVLRGAQQSLGEVHDRQVLLDDISRAVQRDETLKASAGGLQAVLEAECRALYREYLTARADIVGLCDALLQWSTADRAGRRRRRMLTIGAVALPSAALLLVQHGRSLRPTRRVPA
jgi:CHAD domain-containing protein